MFIKQKTQFISEINSNVTIYIHDKTKARICTMENDDPNKVFSIAFRTPPIDDTGLTHILEHSVLCGSKKYPVKDPFVELLKGSLNTFLNAFTFPDKTMYPVASMNDKDFKNLMDIYLDAVFNPNIYNHEEIFRQEGWHYHLENKDDDISINGVVYNEMKGAFSDPEQVLGRSVMHSLFPHTPYGKESGGDPKYIPTLTYEKFKEFHQKYYHPSNCYIFLYGNMDMNERLNFLEDEYLNKYEYNDFNTLLSFEPKFNNIVKEEYFYPLEEDKEMKDNTYLSYNVAYGSTLNIKEVIAIDILSEILFDVPGAPVKEALLNAGICKDVDITYESGILEPFLSIVLKGSNKESYDKFIKIVNDTLSNIKLDKEALLASINFREFKTREAKFDGPKGLLYQMNALDSWLYDDNMPFEKLNTLKYYDELKEDINTSYFYDLISKVIINNPHKSYVSLHPSKTLEKEKEQELRDKLSEYKKSLSDEEIGSLVKNTLNLLEYQSEPSTKEELDTIPKLSIDDIDKDPIKFNIEKKESKFISYYSNYFTNGISYVKYMFDISNLPLLNIKYAKLISYLMGSMNTKSLTYNDINKQIKLHTGGFSTSINNFRTTKQDFKLFYTISYSYVSKEEDNAYDLISDIFNNTIYTDKERFKNLINKNLLALEQNIISSGHIASMLRTSSYTDKLGFVMDSISGIGYLDFIQDISKNMDNNFDEIIKNINDTINMMFNKSQFLFDCISDENLYDNAYKLALKFYDDLEDDKIDSKLDITLGKLNEGVVVSSNVNYVCRSGDLGIEPKGDILVLKNALSLDYLWMNVRVKGGAYGCSIKVGRFGDVALVSYRDPNVKRTSDIYLDLYKFIENLDINEDDLLKLKIGAIGSSNDSYHNSTLGSMALSNELSGISYDMRKQNRMELLGATIDDLKKYAPLFKEAFSKDIVCVIGNASSIDKDKALFKNIRSLTK